MDVVNPQNPGAPKFGGPNPLDRPQAGPAAGPASAAGKPGGDVLAGHEAAQENPSWAKAPVLSGADVAANERTAKASGDPAKVRAFAADKAAWDARATPQQKAAYSDAASKQLSGKEVADNGKAAAASGDPAKQRQFDADKAKWDAAATPEQKQDYENASKSGHRSLGERIKGGFEAAAAATPLGWLARKLAGK